MGVRNVCRRLRLRFSVAGLFVFIGLAAVSIAWWHQSTPDLPVRTGGELDAAIFGRGFFKLVSPSGREFYTRNGRFEVNDSGHFAPRPDDISLDDWVLADGISVPVNHEGIKISSNGEVSALISGVDTHCGQLSICRFQNPARLIEVMPGVLAATTQSGPEILGSPGVEGWGFIQQGWVEGNGRSFLAFERSVPYLSLVILSYLVVEIRNSSRAIAKIQRALSRADVADEVSKTEA